MIVMRIAICVALGLAGCSSSKAADSKNPEVVFETNQGTFVLRLFQDKAPITTKNILDYVDAGFYDGLIFHRVIKGFMLQGGGYTADLKPRKPRAPIKNEATNGLKNKRGTVAMARRPDPNSATSQFFINTADNAFLDHKSTTPRGMGYCVFGEVAEGMDVVEKIENVKTLCPSRPPGPCHEALPPGMRDVPAKPGVMIKKAYRKK